MKNTWLLIGGAIAAYFLFLKPKPATPATTTAAPATLQNTLSQVASGVGSILKGPGTTGTSPTTPSNGSGAPASSSAGTANQDGSDASGGDDADDPSDFSGDEEDAG